jgi:hypothetical protein
MNNDPATGYSAPGAAPAPETAPTPPFANNDAPKKSKRPLIFGSVLGALVLVIGAVVLFMFVLNKPSVSAEDKNAAIARIQDITGRKSSIKDAMSDNLFASSFSDTEDSILGSASAEAKAATEELKTAVAEIKSLFTVLEKSSVLNDSKIKEKYEKAKTLSNKIIPALDDMVTQSLLFIDVMDKLEKAGLLDGTFGLDAETATADDITAVMTELQDIFEPLAGSSNTTIATMGKDIQDLFSAMVEFLGKALNATAANAGELLAAAEEIEAKVDAFGKKYSEETLTVERLFGITETDITEFFTALDDLLAALKA